MRGAYYNEIEPYAAQWLRNLIAKNLIPRGEVDERSIVDVQPGDLVGFQQCHFFAGIGGWAFAARLAGWPDDREFWTGSCPCQPFSVAGKQRGTDDERHLWPHQLRLLSARRPAVWMGEQVAAAVGKDWLDGVLSDLEGIGYAGGAVVVPACAVDGPHRRDRLWIVADRGGALGDGFGARLEGYAGHGDGSAGRALADRPTAEASGGGALADADQPGACEGREQRGGEFGGAGRDPCACAGAVADAECQRREVALLAAGAGAAQDRERQASQPGVRSAWGNAAWIIGHDGKARRVEPGIRLLAHGVPARVGKLRAYGNAIAPPLAAEVIAAYMDARP